MKIAIAGALCASLFAASMTAQAEVSPEDQIQLRKAGYSFMSWNMGKIKEQVIDESVTYNPDQMLAAANAISAISKSGMGALFGPGTEQNVGDQVTRVKPEMFDNTPDVIKLSGDLTKAADNLVSAAVEGDQSKVRSAFGQVGDTCKACHDKYRQK
ncbi:c-type cytochrome [Pseudomonas saliphila]|uniref:c-type cytochrome n=1 Tax=Pseudomonas saliphila TaxID=2586906 RepID=UPI00123C708F|nr:cytochrome c [Pseudomonas saliphila]